MSGVGVERDCRGVGIVGRDCRGVGRGLGGMGAIGRVWRRFCVVQEGTGGGLGGLKVGWEGTGKEGGGWGGRGWGGCVQTSGIRLPSKCVRGGGAGCWRGGKSSTLSVMLDVGGGGGGRGVCRREPSN